MAQRKVNCEVYTDRGIVGKEGADGKSAYQQAVEGGYQGTEEEFEQALASDIATVANNVTNINVVGNNIENVNTAVDNMSAIIAAPTAATQAEASASQAATSATNAQTSETNSATSASNAAESATNASVSATIATTKASEATSSATSASASANSASASATSASISAANAEIWAEGTDAQVTTLGGEHSSKGWANIAKQYVESIGAALKYKGSVSTYSDLPSTGQQNGDVWNVLDTGANYAWTGTEWDKLSETVDLSGYYTKTEVDTFVAEQETNITTVQNDLAGLGDQVSVIESKIPAEASETNQLADKNYVDSVSGGSGFDFEGTKSEFDAAVAAGTITEDSVSLITDDVSGDNVATKAELQDKVSKTGDTMTGPLVIQTQSEIRLGTEGNYYYIKKNGNGYLEIYNNNKGLFLQASDPHTPYYFDGTNAYRLLTTADLANIDYVVESQVYAEGFWYRKYKSGWVEQGGQYRTTTIQRQTWGVVTFIKPFTDTNYTVQAVAHSPYRDTTCLVYMSMASIGNKTTTKVDVGVYSVTNVDKNNGFDWTACGQGAN